MSEAGLDLKYVWVQKTSCDLALFLPPFLLAQLTSAQQEGEEKQTAREHDQFIFPFSLHCIQKFTPLSFSEHPISSRK